jgi:hypothetical protein
VSVCTYIGLAALGVLVAWLLVRSAQRATEHKTEASRRYFKRYAIDYERKERK